MWRTPDAAASLSSDLPCAPWVCQVCTMILGGGDPTTDAMIEQRRRLDKERLMRIKDPKTRTMGIDTQALAGYSQTGWYEKEER